jgi:hypothetical protein
MLSTATHRELSSFVQNHVLVCQTSLVEELLKREILNCDDITNLSVDNEDPQDIYEWWIVDRWLLDKLEAHGQPVLRTAHGDWWGRTATGQSITLDSVIEDIYQGIGKCNV